MLQNSCIMATCSLIVSWLKWRTESCWPSYSHGHIHKSSPWSWNNVFQLYTSWVLLTSQCWLYAGWMMINCPRRRPSFNSTLDQQLLFAGNSLKCVSCLSGWRPRRSIVFCSWGAEEYGIIGSTEWVEVSLMLYSTFDSVTLTNG